MICFQMRDSLILWSLDRKFRYENKWFEDDDLPMVVQRSWQGFGDFEITRRLLTTGDSLTLWGNHIATAYKQNKKELEVTTH